MYNLISLSSHTNEPQNLSMYVYIRAKVQHCKLNMTLLRNSYADLYMRCQSDRYRHHANPGKEVHLVKKVILGEITYIAK